MVSAAQAEMQDELEDAKRNAPWVDITQGMELSERLEHKLELQGRMQLLDPSHPEALNFNEEQSFKSLSTAGTNASLYTSTQSVSLGGTAFEPRDDDNVDSQELSFFGGSNSSKAEDNLEDDTEGVFIENMGAFSLRSSNNPPPPDGHENSGNAKPDGAESGQDGLVHSPGKVTWMASISSGFSAGVASDHRRDIKEMISKWIDGHGSDNIPAQMADLARRAHVNINKLINPLPTPQWRGQREKAFSTPTAAEGAREGILTGLRFVLTGVWPYQGSGTGLALGKERVKSRIEKFGSTVTLSISRLTDALVVGDAPGPKKVIEAHNRSMKIITLEQLNNLILGDIILEDLTSADYPKSAYAVLDAANIQVQRHPHSSVSQEQAHEGTAEETLQGQDGDAEMAGNGHTNG